MMQRECPNCGAPLPKMPTRKTMCKACGEFMFVKYTPDDRTKRLMTEQQASAADAAWEAQAVCALAEQLAVVAGIKPMKTVAATQAALMALASNPKADRQQRKAAADGLIRLAATHEGRESWSVLSYAMDLEILQASGGAVSQVMIRGESERCAVCARLDRQVIAIDQALSQMPLPPRDCPKLAEGYGCLCWYRAVIPGWGGA